MNLEYQIARKPSKTTRAVSKILRNQPEEALASQREITWFLKGSSQ